MENLNLILVWLVGILAVFTSLVVIITKVQGSEFSKKPEWKTFLKAAIACIVGWFFLFFDPPF